MTGLSSLCIEGHLLPLCGAHVSQERFTFRWPLPRVAGSPDRRVLSASLTSARPLGPLQIVLCGLAFGAIAMGMGLGPEYAVILGGALALSSTAVVVQALAEHGQQSCPVGLTGTAVLIFQDIFAIFLLIFAASLESGDSTVAESSFAITVFLAILKAAVAFVVAVVIGRYAVRPLFSFLTTTKNEEVFTATALLVVLATAVATGGAGLSLTLVRFWAA